MFALAKTICCATARPSIRSCEPREPLCLTGSQLCSELRPSLGSEDPRSMPLRGGTPSPSCPAEPREEVGNRHCAGRGGGGGEQPAGSQRGLERGRSLGTWRGVGTAGSVGRGREGWKQAGRQARHKEQVSSQGGAQATVQAGEEVDGGHSVGAGPVGTGAPGTELASGDPPAPTRPCALRAPHCRGPSSRGVGPCHAIPGWAVPDCAAPCQAVPAPAMPCHAEPCCA